MLERFRNNLDGDRPKSPFNTAENNDSAYEELEIGQPYMLPFQDQNGHPTGVTQVGAIVRKDSLHDTEYNAALVKTKNAIARQSLYNMMGSGGSMQNPMAAGTVTSRRMSWSSKKDPKYRVAVECSSDYAEIYFNALHEAKDKCDEKHETLARQEKASKAQRHDSVRGHASICFGSGWPNLAVSASN